MVSRMYINTLNDVKHIHPNKGHESISMLGLFFAHILDFL